MFPMLARWFYAPLWDSMAPSAAIILLFLIFFERRLARPRHRTMKMVKVSIARSSGANYIDYPFGCQEERHG
jgi:hypothetical protein